MIVAEHPIRFMRVRRWLPMFAGASRYWIQHSSARAKHEAIFRSRRMADACTWIAGRHIENLLEGEAQVWQQEPILGNCDIPPVPAPGR